MSHDACCIYQDTAPKKFSVPRIVL